MCIDQRSDKASVGYTCCQEWVFPRCFEQVDKAWSPGTRVACCGGWCACLLVLGLALVLVGFVVCVVVDGNMGLLGALLGKLAVLCTALCHADFGLLRIDVIEGELEAYFCALCLFSAGQHW